MKTSRGPWIHSCALTLALVLTAFPAPRAVAQERVYRGPDGQDLPFGTDADIVEALENGQIVESQVLGSGTTGVKRLVLEYEGARLRAVFRHVDEVKRNIQLRDGSNFAGFYDQYSAECAAYELGRLLGLDMIPPAALRPVEGMSGSVQLWVEDAMTEGDRIADEIQPPNLAKWRREQSIMRAFDALIANQDRNTGNSLIDADWNLWLIDHSRTFQIPRGEPSFTTVNQLPEPFWLAVKALEKSPMSASTAGAVSRGPADAFAHAAPRQTRRARRGPDQGAWLRGSDHPLATGRVPGRAG